MIATLTAFFLLLRPQESHEPFVQDVNLQAASLELFFLRADSKGESSLCVSSIDGKNMRTLRNNVYSFAISPDGKKLAFTSDKEEAEGTRAITYLTIADRYATKPIKEIKRLFHRQSLESLMNRPAWSPDSSQLAYFAPNNSGGSSGKIMILDLAKMEGSEIKVDSPDFSVGNIAWTSDDRILFDYMPGEGGEDGLFSLPKAGGKAQRLFTARSVEGRGDVSVGACPSARGAMVLYSNWLLGAICYGNAKGGSMNVLLMPGQRDRSGDIRYTWPDVDVGSKTLVFVMTSYRQMYWPMGSVIFRSPIEVVGGGKWQFVDKAVKLFEKATAPMISRKP